MLGTSPEQEQGWKRYAGALIVFSGSRSRSLPAAAAPGLAPAQPQHLVRRTGAQLQHAASFLTNTNWQNYGGETTMSYFSQIGALTVQQFVSPAVGIVAAIASCGFFPGATARRSATSGST